LAGILSIAIHLVYAAVPEIAPPSGYWIRTETAASNLLLSAGYALLSAKTARWVKPWMPLAAFGLGAVFYLDFFHWLLPMSASPFLLAFAANHLAAAPRIVRSALSSAPLRLLGICSYSIYLWQQPFYRYQESFAHAANGEALLALLMALGVGMLMFYCFENPARAYLNRVW
jgi:peptidoglycan/LPS O-acetylase OafA/YrhL